MALQTELALKARYAQVLNAANNAGERPQDLGALARMADRKAARPLPVPEICLLWGEAHERGMDTRKQLPMEPLPKFEKRRRRSRRMSRVENFSEAFTTARLGCAVDADELRIQCLHRYAWR